MNTFTKLVVGQEVVIGEWTSYYDCRYTFDWTVTKVTPTGRTTVTRLADGYSRHFNAKGRETTETGAEKHHPAQVITDVAAVRAECAARDRAQAAAAAILAVRVRDSRATYGKDSLLAQVAELEALLAKARAAVQAI